MVNIMEKTSTVLRKAVMEKRAVVVPGCYDPFSAKIIEKCGFEAVQVSGYGVAGSYLGRPDVGLLEMKEVLEVTYNICRAVKIPVMADIDTGGGNACNALHNTEKLIIMGCGGMNIEDQIFPKRCGHMTGKEVISAEEMAGKVRACAAVRNRLDKDFIINARTDAAGVQGLGLDEAIRRANMYLEAGADLAFIDGIKTKADVIKAVKEVKGPISVNMMDAISGMKTELIPIPELAKLGVGRVSIPVASIMVVQKALTNFFTELKKSPTGLLEGQKQWVCSFEEYTDFVGLKEYKKNEDEYLPQERLGQKYHGEGKIVDDKKLKPKNRYRKRIID